MSRGLLIAIEGLDASGKTTQMKNLLYGVEGVTLKFPAYDTEVGKLILAMLKGELAILSVTKYTGDTPIAAQALVLQSLMTVNRYEMLPAIEKELSKGTDVYLDRYFLSGIVYGLADKLPLDWLMAIHEPLLKPDLYVLLDISSAESFKRRPNRADAYEADKERLAFVSCEYRAWWTQHGKTFYPETTWLHIDGMTDPAVVTHKIREAISAVRIKKDKRNAAT